MWLNKALAQMSEKRLAPRQVALAFLKEQPQVWEPWVPVTVAAKVKAGL